MGVANLSGRDSIPLAIWNRTIIVVSTAQLFNYFALSTHARAYAAVNATVPIFTFQAVLGEKKKQKWTNLATQAYTVERERRERKY